LAQRSGRRLTCAICDAVEVRSFADLAGTFAALAHRAIEISLMPR